MAKKLRDEDLILNIVVNGDNGKKEIGELERAIKDTTSEMRALEKQERALKMANKEGTKEYKAVTAAIKAKSESITLAEARLKQLRSQVDVNKMSLADLRSEMNKVKRLRDISTPLTDEWRRHDARLKEVTARYQDLSGQATHTGSSIQNLAGKFNHYVGVITAGFATFGAVIFGLSKAINSFAEFDDKVADVMKTTGLLRNQVIQMNESLKSLNTRTAQNDLLGLARIAGKLGITGVENVEGFVRATDQINVALSEDLGGDVEEAINAVGKLVDIFNVDEDFGIEQGLLKVGSAINTLGASSTANEGYLVDFAKRTAGIAPSAKISLENILGLAATLDKLGQTSEVSSTTFNTLIPEMFTNTAQFAKLANMEVDEFTHLLNTDANEAFLRFLDGVKGNNSGLSELIGNISSLGVDGARATSVLAVLANNTEDLRTQQQIANEAFKQGTSITDEFNIKNETAAAKLEKARKGFQNMTVELGEKLMPAMTMSTSGMSYFLKILSALIDFIRSNYGAIVTITSALVAYNVALFVQNKLMGESIILAKARVFWANTMLVAEQLLAAATMLLSGNLKGAAQAMRVLNSVVAANPWAALAAVVVMAGVALYQYTKGLTAAELAQKKLNDIMLDAESSIAKERVQLELLLETARDKTRSDAERLKAIEELNRIVPQYNNQLTLEKINTEEATKATDLYIDSLVKKAAIQAAEESLVDIQKQRLEELKTGAAAELSFWQKSKALFIAGVTNNAAIGAQKAGEMMMENRAQFTSELDAQENILKNFLKENKFDAPSTQVVPVSPFGANAESEIVTIATLKEKLSSLQTARDAIAVNDIARLNANEKAQREIQAKIDAADVKSSSGRVANSQKEADQVKKIQDDKLAKEEEYRQKVLESELTMIEQERMHFAARLAEAGLAGKDREQMTEQELRVLLALQRQHESNLAKLDQTAISKEFEIKQQAHDRKIMVLRTQNNEEKKEIQNLEDAKKYLRGTVSDETLNELKNLREAQQLIDKQHLAEEEKLTEDYLNGLIAEMQSLSDSGQLEGIDLANKLLSPEQKEELEKRIEEVKLALSQLGNPTDEGSDKPKEKMSFGSSYVGFSKEQWETFFGNINAGKTGMNELVMGAQAMTNAYAQYSAFVSAGERKQLQEYQRTSDRKKTALQNQLDAGIMTQEQYADQVARIDRDLDRKKAVIDRNEAKRERNVALMSAIVNTASAIAEALPNVPLSIIAGAMGALQIGTIVATPLPAIPGAESGGFLEDVTRSQDGKMFRARRDPDKRGFVDRPTIITGESGREFVANHDAVTNPTIAPVLAAIDTAQRQGSISSMNLFKVLEQNRDGRARMAGRAKGGTFSGAPVLAPASADQGGSAEVIELLRQSTKAIASLNERLRKPIKSEVVLTGRSSLEEKQEELSSIQSRANI